MSAPPLPRELVRASAGTGKTYTISSRIVGLLAAGAEPDEVLASTFTRKAAGEILDRVLTRLARACLDPGATTGLVRDSVLPGGAANIAGRDDALRLLGELVRRLHRIDVGTLDALFVRTARCFALELGMPPGWTIADEPLERRLRAEALHEVLGGGEAEDLVELVRRLGREHASRRVYERLQEQADDLLRLRRELEPGSDEPWSPFERVPRPDDPVAERERLADRLEAIEPPATGSGRPHSGWADELERAAEAVREGDWDALFGKGIGAKVASGDTDYYSKPIGPEVAARYEEASDLARAELAPEYDRQARAMGRFARRYEEAFAARQREVGAYRFEDVAHLLGAGDRPVTAREDLAYRLDRRAAHVLLDEFQDTSQSQWTVLRPLLDRVSAAPREASALVVVADTKQSIYGWRGADPRLVERVSDRYGLTEHRLDRSWRSSPVVLGFVNDLFGEIGENPVLAGVDEGPEETRRWASAFDRHRPAGPRAGEPGRVVVEAGPPAGDGGTMALAAERAKRLHREAPDARIGVLTYTNRSVARVIHELRRRGVEASEEGGTSVDDAAPVAAVLALFRLADHPGDTIARYHVAATPLGRLLGFTDHRDAAAARRLSRRVRRRLVSEGYGAVLADWARGIATEVTPAELRRLEQLVELGYRWEGRATLRPEDFARFVRSERVEDPLAAPVRVMTVHQAKGLEFDAVVLPELDRSIAGRGSGPALPERDPETGRVLRVFPRIGTGRLHLFPEVEEAARQELRSGLRDALSFLYVAVTRARYGLHVLLPADPEKSISGAKSLARVVRAALDAHDRRVEEGEILYERGEPDWHGAVESAVERGSGLGRPGARAEPEEPAPLRVAATAPRRRILSRLSPSEAEGGGEVDLSERLRVDRDRAFVRGSLVHAWCEEIGWLEDGLPERSALLGLGRRVAPRLTDEEIAGHLEGFLRWLEAPAARRALSKQAALERLGAGRPAVADPPRAGELHLEVRTERPFAFRRGDEIVSGAIDRLVVARRTADGAAPGPTVAAEVLDYKTDEVGGGADLEARVEHYRPQLELYRAAAASLHRLEPGAVAARLLFLPAGELREV